MCFILNMIYKLQEIILRIMGCVCNVLKSSSKIEKKELR